MHADFSSSQIMDSLYASYISSHGAIINEPFHNFRATKLEFLRSEIVRGLFGLALKPG